MTRTANRLLALFCLVAIVALLPFVVPFFSPWSDINSEHQDIDIKTGRARFQRYFWFVRVSSRTEDTMVSELLGGREVNVADVERWRRVNTFGPYLLNSPHHSYHGALSQIRYLELVFSIYQIPDVERRDAAEELLVAWQQAGDYFAAEEFIQKLQDEYEKRGADDGPWHR